MQTPVNVFQSGDDFRTGTVLLVDKPLDWTSFDVVNKLRFAIRKRFGFRKIKVGHAGTLDPRATGLLIICTGKMTKQINDFMGADKVYTGQIKLGETTPSYDSETEVNGTFPVEHISRELVEQAMRQMLGTHDQTPPVFSAKKIDGKKAYELARKGVEVQMRTAPVTIHEFEITHFDLPWVEFRAKCSKGTYIRSLAHDLGLNLNSGAYLTALRRTASGDFSVDQSESVESLVERIGETPPGELP